MQVECEVRNQYDRVRQGWGARYWTSSFSVCKT